MTITRYSVATALAVCCILGAAPSPRLDAERSAGALTRLPQPGVTYSESFVEEIVEPAPAPIPEDPSEHGPFVGISVMPVKVVSGGRTSIEFLFQC